jgi:hypothetical protein
MPTYSRHVGQGKQAHAALPLRLLPAVELGADVV